MAMSLLTYLGCDGAAMMRNWFGDPWLKRPSMMKVRDFVQVSPMD